jgi:parallel beta-helix repeat protein
MAIRAWWCRGAFLSVMAVAVTLSAACSSKPDRDASDPLSPGPLAAAELQLRMIEAKPGTVIRLAAGRFEFTRGLSLDANRVTIRGAGPDATILSFSGQTEAGEGLLVTGDDVRLEGFAVVDTRGDGIKSKGADRIIYRNLRVAWSGAPKTTNGAYGVYPVESKDVLIDGVTVRGASDAGIYVGQSRQVIVRNSRAEFNVAGIEIENSSNVDVFGNIVTNNTGGILVFNLPDLPVKDGRDIRVFDNQVFSNNTPNFAPPGNIVASVPTGTGIMVMAARGVHVFRNQLSMNQTAHLLIASYFLPLKDPYFDPLPADVVVRGNKYGVGGDSPQGMLKPLAAAIGGGLPAIVWDGVTTHRLTRKAPTLAILEPPDVGFLDLRLARTPVDLSTADPAPVRPPAVRVAEPEPVVVPQDPL